MSESFSATCILLGEGPLPMQCLDILTDKGFEILAFISRDEELQAQAARYDFPFLSSTCLLDRSIQPDYIFSINNGIILKPDFIARAGKLAINYHDSPLPKYAGMYAPNWALMNQENKHAVTWHVLDQGIDTGDILEQEFIDITDLEPIWSVNMKCFGAALLSFERLIRKIASGKMHRTPQNETNRSYFPLMARPFSFGLVTSDRTMKELETLQQATQYGSLNDNEFLLPHLYVGKEYYTITKYRLEVMDVKKPGTILIEKDKVGFFCNDGFVVPEQLFDRKCRSVDFREILLKEGLKAGDILNVPENPEEIATLFANLCKKEMFWKMELAKTEMLPFPFARNNSQTKERQSKKLEINFSDSLNNLIPDEDPTLSLMALFGAFMLRINDLEAGTLGFIPPNLPTTTTGLNTLFRTELPLNLNMKDVKGSKGFLLKTLNQLKTITRSGLCTVDMPLRYKSLKSVADEDFAMVLCSELPNIQTMNEHSIYVAVKSTILDISIPGKELEKGMNFFTESLKSFVSNVWMNPDAPLHGIPLLDSVKTNLMLEGINQPCGETYSMSGILSQFDKMVLQQADKPALIDGDHVFTYRKLQTESQQLANLLQQKGVKPNDIILICLPRCYGFFVAQWAILRCGAAFLPIDSSMPDDRKSFIMDDSGALYVITNESFANVFPDERTILLHELPASEETLEITPIGGDLAYLIYTSGSTGVPKGVRISHTALTSFVSAAIGTYGFTSADRVLQFSNLGFDASIEEVFCTLCSGGTLYLRNEEMLDPEVLIQFSINHEISIWDFPTAFWRQVLAATNDDSFPVSLRAIIIGGEAISNSDFENWKKHPSSKCRLFNTYGPTETTVVATVFEVTTDYLMDTNIPIGNPLPGYRVFITDKNRNLLPVYLPGELLIAGPALADGYLNRDEAQKNAFVQVAIQSQIFRCYCTGDQVFSDETGRIHYIGRTDGQLKIRGFRVEPGEIENQIMQLGGIKHCVVLGKANEKGEKQLVAFLVPLDDKTRRADTLKTECMRILPNYMIPEHFIQVSEIPMTPNGKIDKKVLLTLALPVKKKPISTKKQEITTPLQEKLIHLWRDVLEDNSLSLDDDFFENGGHSLRAVRLMASIKKELDAHLPLSSLISYPTPRTMAQALESKDTDNLWKCLVPIRAKGNKMPLYLIHGAGLNVLLYQSLGNHLDPERPIYALQAKGLDGKSALSTSIEEMAADYIEEIRKNQPQGPYAIFGFSMGGFIAFEMGRQLIEQNQEVAFLGVIDTVTTYAKEILTPLRKTMNRLRALVGKPLFFLYVLAREPWKGKIKFLHQKYRNIRGTLLYYASRFGLINNLAPKTQAQNDQPVYLSSKASVIIDTALMNYVLKPMPVTLDLFRADKQMFYIQEPKTYGWSKYAQKDVVVHNVPGEHSELFAPPNDALFAKKLTDRLNELDKNG